MAGGFAEGRLSGPEEVLRRKPAGRLPFPLLFKSGDFGLKNVDAVAQLVHRKKAEIAADLMRYRFCGRSSSKRLICLLLFQHGRHRPRDIAARAGQAQCFPVSRAVRALSASSSRNCPFGVRKRGALTASDDGIGRDQHMGDGCHREQRIGAGIGHDRAAERRADDGADAIKQ